MKSQTEKNFQDFGFVKITREGDNGFLIEPHPELPVTAICYRQTGTIEPYRQLVSRVSLNEPQKPHETQATRYYLGPQYSLELCTLAGTKLTLKFRPAMHHDGRNGFSGTITSELSFLEQHFDF